LLELHFCFQENTPCFEKKKFKLKKNIFEKTTPSKKNIKTRKSVKKIIKNCSAR